MAKVCCGGVNCQVGFVLAIAMHGVILLGNHTGCWQPVGTDISSLAAPFRTLPMLWFWWRRYEAC